MPVIKSSKKIKGAFDNTVIKKEDAMNKYSDALTNIIKSKHNKRYEAMSVYESSLNCISSGIIRTAQHYTELIEEHQDFFRLSTIPFNYIYFLYLKAKMKLGGNVLFAHGVHFFVALQGGGKSTLAFELIERLRIDTGKSAYVNAHFELARKDYISNKEYKHHKFFELMEFFDMEQPEYEPDIKVTQKKQFNKNFTTIVLDEWLTEMNHRLNKTKDYNNIFLAMITMIAHMRHQKMDRIYVLSQIDNTDIQLMSMFKYQHEIEIDLDIPYVEWVKSGKMHRHIKGWYVTTFGVRRNRKKQGNEKVRIKDQYIKKTADFEYFDTFSQSGKYEMLPEDKIDFV